MGTAVLDTGGNVPPLICQCPSHRSNSKGRWWRGHQIKASFSNTGWSMKHFVLSKRARLTFFFPCLWKLVLHFLKANFRTNGELSHKIRWVYANSNLKNANSALIVWSQPQRPALQVLSSSKQLTSQSSRSAPLNKQEGTEKISRKIFFFPPSHSVESISAHRMQDSQKCWPNFR